MLQDLKSKNNSLSIYSVWLIKSIQLKFGTEIVFKNELITIFLVCFQEH